MEITNSMILAAGFMISGLFGVFIAHKDCKKIAVKYSQKDYLKSKEVK